MRYKHPRAEMSPNGIYGGVGSKNAPRAWTPQRARRRRDGAYVRRTLRGLRVRRTRRSRMEPTPSYVLIPVVTVAIPMVGFALYWLWDFVEKTFLR